MTSYLYAEVNVVGGVVLLLILTNQNRTSFSRMPLDQQIFSGVMLVNVLIFVFDTGMWLTDGVAAQGMRILDYIMTTLYYLCNPIISYLWLLYTHFRIHESKADLLRRARFYAVPLVISSVLTLASPAAGWFFAIDEENRYIRGPLFLVMAGICGVYLLLSVGMAFWDAFKNGWERNRSVVQPLIMFPLVTIAAAVVQIRFFGISVIWVCTMLACTSIYINIQNTEVSTDHLTGLNNRRRLDQFLQRRIQMKRGSGLLFVIILDLDEFKKINDTCGHNKGDEILVCTAELLRRSCSGEDFIARLGGDEFVIVGERSSIAEIERFTRQISANAADYNRNNPSQYPLGLSMGYSVLRKTDTADSLIAAADGRMYHCKEQHRQRPSGGEPC